MYDTCILNVDVDLVASKSNSHRPFNHGGLNKECSLRFLLRLDRPQSVSCLEPS